MSFPVVVNLVQAADLLLLLSSGLLAKEMVTSLNGRGANGSLFLATIVGAATAICLLIRRDAYALRSLSSLGKQLELLAAPILIGHGVLIISLFLMHEDGPGFRQWPLLSLCCSIVLFLVSRSILGRLLQRWTESGRLARRVAVIGAGEFSRNFIERLRTEPQTYTLVGLYDDRLSRLPPAQDGVELRGTVTDLLERSRQERIDIIVIALPLSAVDRISAILGQIGSAVADVCLTTDFTGLRYNSGQISSVGSNPVVLIKEHPLKDWKEAKKLAFDKVVGSLLFIVFSPLLALIAMWIRLDSVGPILFRQPRLGFNNRPFICYKFRTMHNAMTDLMADSQTVRNDPRITRIGRWLRKLSLDELPQLWNVLKGEMSLVGPRPHALNTKAADRPFSEVVARYAVRHRVKPGLTGWAQVNGWRGETKTIEQIENRVACDLAYIESWSMWFDLRILLLTITREILSRNAF